jgi:Golgi apparatus protein 1
MFTIGAIGRCLSKALVTGQALAPPCRTLVLVAAPKDSRLYLQYPESASALVTKIAELQRAAGVGGLGLGLEGRQRTRVGS